jgi:tRNA(fMet)-specific endonuclease VapC
MRLALDTNRYVDFCRGETEAVERLREAERIYRPCVTLAELRAGFLCGTQAPHNERVLTRFRLHPAVGSTLNLEAPRTIITPA